MVGERGGRIVVSLTAPPVGGRGNKALRKLIAKRLGVARGRVEVVRGAASRDKLVRVSGLDRQALRSRLLD